VAPKFAKYSGTADHDKLLKTAKTAARLVFIGASPILLILGTAGMIILKYVFGAEFTAAYWPLIILLIGQAVNISCGSTGIFLAMTGHHKAFRNIIIFSALITLCLQIILVPLSGIYGAAISTAVGMALWNLASLIYIKKKFGLFIGFLPIISFR